MCIHTSTIIKAVVEATAASGWEEEEPGSCEMSAALEPHQPRCMHVLVVKADVIYFNIFLFFFFYNKTHEQALLVCGVFGVGAGSGCGIGRDRLMSVG